DLLAAHGNAYDINLRVFRHMHSTITGWPGGKPEHAKQVGDRPGHRDDIFPKRIIVFSPHPDDDVISMGGTLIRLVEQGHEVHIAYQTSGNIAVFDEDAIRFAEFVEDFCSEFKIHAPGLEELESHIDEVLRKKQPGQVDSDQVQRIKGLIRRGEAREGVIIDGEGKVLTAAHVAMRPNKPATVILANGRRLKAMTLGSNKNVDAGMLQISPGQNEGEDWPHATLGSSGKLSPGMWCIATGHPSGFDQDRGVVTRVGRISRVNRSALRTDCALIGGDSGGPLFDLSGQLIAIHSRIGNDVEENLHIPIDNYSNSWERLVAGDFWGSLPGFRPVLGVQGSSQIEEAVIDVVRLGSAAKKAGIQKGDIIKEFGDRKINDFQSLKEAVAETMPGEIVRVRGLRDGSPVFFRVVIGRGE
ncbi:trypsin-like peptidase domain-containing protein, partial [Rubripirellula sp.]